MMVKNKSSASGSGSSSSVGDRSSGQRDSGFVCYCGKTALIRQAWTDANPGRRFYRCGEVYKNGCDYFRWRDVDKPYGWQKIALLEARNVIREQAEELARLREINNGGSEGEAAQPSVEIELLVEKLTKENEALRQSLGQMMEKEKRIRNIGIVSLVGFIFGVATIIHAKNSTQFMLP